LGINGELLIGVQDKRLQDVDRDLAIIVGVLGWAAETGREFIGQRAGEALLRLRAQGRRIGGPPSEQAGRKIVDLVAGGDPLKDARGSWAWATARRDAACQGIPMRVRMGGQAGETRKTPGAC